MRALTSEVRQRGDDLGHELGDGDPDARRIERPYFLVRDGHLGVDVERVVRTDLRAEPILQWRDDAAAVRVVLGVGRRDQHHVERKSHLVATHLNVALLEHVEESDLDAFGEVGQLVDGEDAAVGARHEPVVQGELVGEVTTFGHLDRIDLTDEVGDGRVGRRQLLTEARVVDESIRSACRRRVPG